MLNLGLFRRLWRRQTAEPPVVPAPPIDSHNLLFGRRPSVDHTASAAFSTVVLIGNCIAEGMEIGLSLAKEARSKFRFVAIPLHLRSLQDRDCLDLIGEASHVFVQQLGGLDWPLIKSAMAANGKLFFFPSLVQWNLWPFDSSNGYADDVAQAIPEGRIRHFDGALARLRKIEPDKRKRVARYRDLDFDWASKVDIVAETQRRFHADIDANSDCHLGRFIERNYKDRRLFYNATHPSEIIF